MTNTPTLIPLLPAVQTFIAKTHGLIIDGQDVSAINSQTFQTINPATGSPLSTVASGNAADIDTAVASARRAFPAWAAMLPAQREKVLHCYADLVEAHKEELAQLETLDNGKPFSTAFNVEVNVALGQLRYAAGLPTKLKGESFTPSSPGFHVYTLREPLGVCGAITPWNYSIVMAMQKIAPALACGNTVVLKPAEQTPLPALRLAELALEAGLPPGVLNVVTGYGQTAGAALAAHPDVNKIAFTGSTETGRAIIRASAGNLKHISLELGGKSPLIIMDDADLDAAVNSALWAIFANSGQNCVAGSRLYIQRGVYQQVLDVLVDRARGLTVAPGLQQDAQLGPLISEVQIARVLRYIDIGKTEGGTVITGGTRLNGDLSAGYFVAPTIFADVADDAALATEEIFGPVLTTFVFDGEEEVIARANATTFGLAAGVFTTHVTRAHRMASALRAGVVWVNTYDWFDAGVPFGGVGYSGYGRELGSQVADLYTELKSVWVR